MSRRAGASNEDVVPRLHLPGRAVHLVKSEEGRSASRLIIPYYTIPYYTILYYTILYYTITLYDRFDDMT